MDNNVEQGSLGKLEQLEADVYRLFRENTDPSFSNYLRSVRDKLISQKYQIDLLRDDLDRNCRMYEERRKRAEEQNVQTQELQVRQEETMNRQADALEEQPVQYGRFSHSGMPAPAMPQRNPVYPAIPATSSIPYRAQKTEKNT